HAPHRGVPRRRVALPRVPPRAAGQDVQVVDRSLPPQPAAARAAEGNGQREFSRIALWDLLEGLRLWKMWLRQSSNEARRRYKRTALGPMWVTVSLLVFALVLSFVWAGLWKMKVSEFLPFLLSGLLPWTLISSAIGEGCLSFAAGEALTKA